MDHHDPNSGPHPSQSIPDAAYPQDAPYHRGQGQSIGLGGGSPHLPVDEASSHSPVYSTGTNTSPPALHPPIAGVSTPAPSTWTPPPGVDRSSPPWRVADPRADNNIPSSPPPPYDATRAPAAYSPLAPVDGRSANDSNVTLAQTQSALEDPRAEAVALVPPPRSPASQHSGEHPNPHSVASTADGGPHKLGPVAQARRRKRRLRICAAFACCIGVFVLAVILGVLFGVIKLQQMGDDGRGPPHGDD